MATAAARRIVRQGHRVASSSAVLLDDHTRPSRDVLAAFPAHRCHTRSRHVTPTRTIERPHPDAGGGDLLHPLVDPDEFADMLLTMVDDPHNHGSLGQVIEFDILRPNDPDAN